MKVLPEVTDLVSLEISTSIERFVSALIRSCTDSVSFIVTFCCFPSGEITVTLKCGEGELDYFYG